jgi:hypothetical protein
MSSTQHSHAGSPVLCEVHDHRYLKPLPGLLNGAVGCLLLKFRAAQPDFLQIYVRSAGAAQTTTQAGAKGVIKQQQQQRQRSPLHQDSVAAGPQRMPVLAGTAAAKRSTIQKAATAGSVGAARAKLPQQQRPQLAPIRESGTDSSAVTGTKQRQQQQQQQQQQPVRRQLATQLSDTNSGACNAAAAAAGSGRFAREAGNQTGDAASKHTTPTTAGRAAAAAPGAPGAVIAPAAVVLMVQSSTDVNDSLAGVSRQSSVTATPPTAACGLEASPALDPTKPPPAAAVAAAAAPFGAALVLPPFPCKEISAELLGVHVPTPWLLAALVPQHPPNSAEAAAAAAALLPAAGSRQPAHMLLQLRNVVQQNSTGLALANAAAAPALAALGDVLGEMHTVEVWPQLRRSTTGYETAAAAAAAADESSCQAKPLQPADRYRYTYDSTSGW